MRVETATRTYSECFGDSTLRHNDILLPPALWYHIRLYREGSKCPRSITGDRSRAAMIIGTLIKGEKSDGRGTWSSCSLESFWTPWRRRVVERERWAACAKHSRCRSLQACPFCLFSVCLVLCSAFVSACNHQALCSSANYAAVTMFLISAISKCLLHEIEEQEQDLRRFQAGAFLNRIGAFPGLISSLVSIFRAMSLLGELYSASLTWPMWIEQTDEGCTTLTF